MASLGTLRRIFATQSVRRLATTATQGEFKRHLVEEEVHAGSEIKVLFDSVEENLS